MYASSLPGVDDKIAHPYTVTHSTFMYYIFLVMFIHMCTVLFLQGRKCSLASYFFLQKSRKVYYDSPEIPAYTHCSTLQIPALHCPTINFSETQCSVYAPCNYTLMRAWAYMDMDGVAVGVYIADFHKNDATCNSDGGAGHLDCCKCSEE